jgi:hypothetical protein
VKKEAQQAVVPQKIELETALLQIDLAIVYAHGSCDELSSSLACFPR